MQNRPLIVCASVVVLSLAALMNLFEATAEQGKQGDPYTIEQQLERLQPALSELPPAATAVGYISDMEIATTRGLLAFNAARYALAPRLLVPLASAKPGDWVLGNFSTPRDFARAGEASGLSMQKDLGNGVVLYRRAAK